MSELWVGLHMFLGGLLLGIIYVLVACIKHFLRRFWFLVVIIEGVFWTLAAVVYCYISYIADSGRVRFYGFAIMNIGIMVIFTGFLLIKHFTNLIKRRNMLV